jgi:hypothetical protein
MSGVGKTIDDFLAGQQDCRNGKEADPKRSENYQRGYGFEYGLGEMASHGYIRKPSEKINTIGA